MGKSRREAMWLSAKLAAVGAAGIFCTGVAPNRRVPGDRLTDIWRERANLVGEVAALRRRAERPLHGAANAHKVYAAIARCEDGISALESEIVHTRAATLSGLTVQAELLTEFCELGALADESDLILARNIAAGLSQMARPESEKI